MVLPDLAGCESPPYGLNANTSDSMQLFTSYDSVPVGASYGSVLYVRTYVYICV